MTRHITSFVVWSNFFYIVPLVVATYASLWTIVAVLFLLFVCSTGFHLFKSQSWSRADTISAYATMVTIVICLFFYKFSILLFSLALVSIGVGLFIRFFMEKGDRHGFIHGFWHLCAALAIFFCLFSLTLKP